MGNFAKQQEVRKDTRERERLSRETLGKFFYDLAKITFTALVVGSIMTAVTQDVQAKFWLLPVFGLMATYAFAYTGYRIMKS